MHFLMNDIYFHFPSIYILTIKKLRKYTNDVHGNGYLLFIKQSYLTQYINFIEQTEF